MKKIFGGKTVFKPPPSPHNRPHNKRPATSPPTASTTTDAATIASSSSHLNASCSGRSNRDGESAESTAITTPVATRTKTSHLPLLSYYPHHPHRHYAAAAVFAVDVVTIAFTTTTTTTTVLPPSRSPPATAAAIVTLMVNPADAVVAAKTVLRRPRACRAALLDEGGKRSGE